MADALQSSIKMAYFTDMKSEVCVGVRSKPFIDIGQWFSTNCGKEAPTRKPINK
jgi:hypothetical protein